MLGRGYNWAIKIRKDCGKGITSDNDTAVLIYYSNVSAGVPSKSTTYAYDSSGNNYYGPRTAIQQLPTTSQWKTRLTNTKRQITTETGTTSTSGGTLPTEFSYEGYAARLLTAQEVNAGCGLTIGSGKHGELSKQCKYLMENTKYSNEYIGSYGEWFESPYAATSSSVWDVYGRYRVVNYDGAINAVEYGVRPAIEVSKSDISY